MFLQISSHVIDTCTNKETKKNSNKIDICEILSVVSYFFSFPNVGKSSFMNKVRYMIV